MISEAVLLQADMTVGQALRRLAQNGYWTDPSIPEVRSWLEECVAWSDQILSGATASLPADRSDGRVAHRTASPTVEEMTRLLARPIHDGWVAVRRQRGVTIFWYALSLTHVLDALTGPARRNDLEQTLQLHEPMSTPTFQAADLPQDGTFHSPGIVLQGQQLVGVNEPSGEEGPGDRSTRGPSIGAGTTLETLDVAESKRGTGAGTTTIPVEVRAYPFLNAPTQVVVDQAFELDIGLSEVPVAGIRSTGEIVLSASAGTTTIPIEVQVVAEGFAAPAGWRRTLVVEVAKPTEARVTVALVPLPQSEEVRLTTLCVNYVVGGVVRGSASRHIIVERNPGIAPAPDDRGQFWLDAEARAAALTLGDLAAKPDVELDISKPDGNPTSGSYQCVMRNAHGVPVPEQPLPIDLGDDAKTFAKTLIDDVRRLGDDPLADNFIVGMGAKVAKKLPREFWTMLAAVAAKIKDRPVTLQLNSAEPYVPWELALVQPALDPKRPIFLAAQVVLGRWILGDASVALPPRDALTIRGMAVMAGMYKATDGLRPLPEAIDEAKTLAQLYATIPAIPLEFTSANFKSLLDATLTFNLDPIGGVDCLHFAGHGEVDPTRPGDAAIYLSNSQPLNPILFLHCKLGLAYSPFVFLNACMVGTGGQLLGDYGGFPGNCLAGGFCGLVAPLWAVNDRVAKSIALEFYRQAFGSPSGRPVAEILRDLRSKYQSDQPVPSYLAYVYYGNPALRLACAPAPLARAGGAGSPQGSTQHG
jgi:hypothetical protein